MAWISVAAERHSVSKNITLLLVMGGLVMLVRLLMIGRRPKNYPPGPPTLPLIGNIHQMPKKQMHLQFQKWAKQYGPIYSLMVGTRTFIILSSDVAVKDLMDKRSNIYSSRPDMYVARDLASGNYRYLMMGYDARWRSARKIAQTFLNVQVSKKYIPYQEMESKQVLNDLLDDPARFKQHIRRFTTSLSAIMIFGYRFPHYTGEEIEKLYQIVDKFSVLGRSTTVSLMDFYPILRWLPDWANSITKKAKEMFQEAMDHYMMYWLKVKQNEKEEIGIKSFSQDLTRAQEKENIDDKFAAFMSGMLMEAGSDTTATTLLAFLQAMALYPDSLRKAQGEVDRVIGPSRLPILDDWDNLPFIRALIKELLRWLPASTLGMPHATTEDNQYMGYLIPKGAYVFGNIWAINSDEKRSPEPRTFRPERYLGDNHTAIDSAALSDPSKRDHMSFGFGRRICQGIHVAERSLFIAISRLVWGFDIHKAKGSSGEEIDIPADKFSDGIILQLDDFQVDIKPRDAARVSVIRREWEDAKAKFREMNLPV